MRKCCHLHLLVLLLRPGIPNPTAFALPDAHILSHAVETWSGPSEVHPAAAVSNPLPNPSESVPEYVRIYVLIGGCTFGGPGGNRTHVQHALL